LDLNLTQETPLRLSGFPGVELHGESHDVDRTVSSTLLRRCYQVHARLYELTVDGSSRRDTEAVAPRFFDSFAVVDPGEAEPLPPPVVVAPPPPKDGVAGLQLAVPEGWRSNYNRFLGVWDLTKPPPTPRSDPEDVRIEPCPANARTPADYASRLKQNDFLNVEVPGWVEVGEREDLPDGFVFKGIVKKYPNPKTPPVLGLLAVREIGGLKVRCFSANLRTETSRDVILEMFKAASFAPPK
jgi:hypothetical protein